MLKPGPWKHGAWVSICCPHCCIHSRREKEPLMTTRWEGAIKSSWVPPASVSLRKRAGSRNVKSPRETRWIWVVKYESQRTSVSFLIFLWKPTGVTMQTVNHVKWLLPNTGKMGQRKWKGWSPVQTLLWPWSDFDEDVNYRATSLKSYPIQARNYWRDMGRKFYEQRFPFR